MNFSIIPHQNWLLIYMMQNMENFYQKAFNVLMTFVNIVQKIGARKFEILFWKNLEFIPQFSEIIDSSSSLLNVKCQFNITELEKILLLPSTYLHYITVST